MATDKTPPDDVEPTRHGSGDLNGADDSTSSGRRTDSHDSGFSVKRLGDFDLLSEIGRGGMGVVYEARQLSLNRRVALKVLPPGLGLTAQAVQRFEREAKAAAKLHHTNIVPVHAIGETDGCHYYAMDLIEGQPLSRILDDLRGHRSSPLMEATITRAVTGERPASEPPAESSSISDTDTGGRVWFDTAARLVLEVAEALHYAHGRGVIHRDVKPANLLLSEDGRLCVSDFGLARVAQEPGMTVSGSFLGTPAYMSPEQIAAGRVKVDHRTDVYSLGAVLYEMLTLERPFPGDSREQILSGIMTKDPRRPRRLNPRVPLDLETICLKAMEKDPDRRYAAAGEMAEDLRRFLRRGLIAARRAGPLRRAGKLVRRHPVAATVIVAVVLFGAAIGTVTSLLSAQKTHEAAQRAVTEARFYLSRGEYRQGLRSVERAQGLAPDLAEARVVRARLLMKLNRAPEAVEEAEAALEQDPDDWTAHLVLAMAARNWRGVDVIRSIPADEHQAAVERHAPETADVYYLQALMAETASEAVSLLDRALELDPAHAEAFLERALRHEDLKDYPAALLDAERLAALRPRSAEGRRILGWVSYLRHDRERALEEFEKALRLDPRDALTYAYRASVYSSMGRTQEQVDDLTRAVEADPGYAAGYALRARAYSWLDRNDDALADAERALELQPDSLAAFQALYFAQLLKGTKLDPADVLSRVRRATADWTGNEERAELHVSLAQFLVAVGDHVQALAEADAAVALLPDKHWTLGQRAEIHRLTGNTTAFEQDCARAAALELDEPEALSQRAAWLSNKCLRRDLAIADYTRAIELAPAWANPYRNRAGRYRAENRFEECLADYAKAIALAPTWGAALRSRADVLGLLERFEEALADLERDLELGNDTPDIRWQRAQILFNLGRDAEAMAQIDKIDELWPESTAGYTYRAVALLYQLGRPAEAVAAFDKAIEAQPGNAYLYQFRAEALSLLPGSCERAAAEMTRARELALADWTQIEAGFSSLHSVFLANVCSRLSDPEAALGAAERVRLRSPNVYSYKHQLGWALYRIGRHAEARDVLLESQRESPRDWPSTHAVQAMVYHRLGQPREARAHYDQAVARAERLRLTHNPYNVLLTGEAARLLELEPPQWTEKYASAAER